jgi:tight adherence protein B
MIVTPMMLTILTFAAGVMAVVAIYSVVSDVFLRDRDRMNRRLNEEFRTLQREQIQKSSVFKSLSQLAAEAAQEESQPTLRARFEAVISQSGLSLTPNRLIAIMAAAGIAAGVPAGIYRQNILIGLGAALLAAAIPFLYVAYRRNARLEKLRSQLPDAFDLMARVIRAGQTISQSIQSVAEEFDQPISGEFNYCYEQQNLGLSPDIALRDLARRTGLLEIKIFVLALLIQQQSGGNLAELLEKLAHVIRERFRIRLKVRALTAEGRMQAVVILLIPVAMMFILMMMSQNYADALARHPNMIIAAFVAEAIGAVWVRRIVNFDF